jgi:ribosomal-protein-alanine N-acetyltransferase
MAVAKQDAVGMPQVTIRSMQESDLKDVVRIEHASYAFPWTEGIFRDCLRVNYVCRVVEVGTDVVGYGIISVGAGEGHVLNICIAGAHRCRGLGRRMLNHLLQVALHHGAQDVLLETRPSNSAALRLYRSLGFSQIGLRRGYYQAEGGREDAIVLKRNIE